MMAFEHYISKAVDIELTKDELGNDVLELQFKYVRFVLHLDDKIKADKIRDLLGATMREEETEKEPVKMPKMYKDDV